MFEFLTTAHRNARKLAAMFDKDREKLLGPFSFRSDTHKLASDRALKAFQIYCVLATLLERGYGAEETKLLDYAIGMTFVRGGAPVEPERYFVDQMARRWLHTYGLEQDECRERSAVDAYCTAFAGLPLQDQETLRGKMVFFHQCTLIDIAGVLGDRSLMRQVTENAALALTPEQLARLRQARLGDTLMLNTEQVEKLERTRWKAK